MKQPLEPIILAAALALLGIGAACLAFFYPTVEQITTVPAATAQGKKVIALKAADIDASLTPWTAPTVWKEPDSHNRLFHSDKYLFFASEYPNGANYIKRLDPLTRSPSGVLLSWLDKNKLDFTDPNVDREDPDNDGFSNLTEFKNEAVGEKLKAADLDGSKSTNPQDAKSHPDYLARLRLAKAETRPFHIYFNGYQQLNGAYVFQLHLKDVNSGNQPPLKKTGDDLGFEGYKVGPFHQEFKDVVDPNTHLTIHKDVSTLELDKDEIGLQVIVPFREEIDSPESTANFVMLMPSEVDKVIKISRGKIFTPPFLPNNSFLVLTATDAGAKIQDTKSKKNYDIPKLDPAEWDEVPLPPASK